MQIYRVKLNLRSALGTPLAADTLFGHLCWGMRYRESVKTLEEFLAEMKSDHPPLLLTDPFPAGQLAAPVLPPLMSSERDELLRLIQGKSWSELVRIPEIETTRKAGNPSRIEAHDILKILSRKRWYPSDTAPDFLDQMSAVNLVKIQLQVKAHIEEPVGSLTPHNKINRLSEGTVEGGLFFTEDLFVTESGCEYDLYVATDRLDESGILELLQNALAGGYGRDKSTGRGVIEIGAIEPHQFPECKNPNAAMLLGPCVPGESDPTEGFWEVFTKEGKLGGHWAVGPGPGGIHNPFKKPVTMLRRGSVLLTDSPQPFYGRMVENVHTDFPDVVQYGLSIGLPVHLIQSEVIV